MLGILIFVAIAGLAWFAGLRGRDAVLALAVPWLSVVLLKSQMPEAWLARQFGGDIRHWLVIGMIGGLVILYRVGLRKLRGLAPEPSVPEAVPQDDTMSDAELDRYARHLVLREIGGPGQMRLRDARVLVVGAGGLGSPVGLYLAAAGVGEICLADDDIVDLSNLQRQVIFRNDQRGESKAEAAAENLLELNPHIYAHTWPHRITEESAKMIASYDLVIDGTDSYASRDAINRACVAAGVPLLAGAIAQWEGQVTLYDPAHGGPCFSCMFPQEPAPGNAPPCAEAGVVGALPGVIGSILALEAIKHLTGAGQGLDGRMLVFDGLYGETRMITIASRPDCPVCGRVAPG
ncbi:HesA/MoeB/ThiF family protein [Paracoccus onubensis]|uniref:Molybdopterin-synthase adenylyltransferase n=1 Tax=Paracoccus onubensis TaxID=1675788 RepID=A0A418SWS9_9RHOB|nr:HesA/MoeB/ThiF family protein [Paracoccus onubensis]RJE85417.1 HesA/MoeB/ThiF family protein [Paracoccus onubensis]